MFDFISIRADKDNALSLEDHVVIRTLAELDETSAQGGTRFAFTSRENIGRQLADNARVALARRYRIQNPDAIMASFRRLGWAVFIVISIFFFLGGWGMVGKLLLLGDPVYVHRFFIAAGFGLLAIAPAVLRLAMKVFYHGTGQSPWEPVKKFVLEKIESVLGKRHVWQSKAGNPAGGHAMGGLIRCYVPLSFPRLLVWLQIAGLCFWVGVLAALFVPFVGKNMHDVVWSGRMPLEWRVWIFDALPGLRDQWRPEAAHIAYANNTRREQGNYYMLPLPDDVQGRLAFSVSPYDWLLSGDSIRVEWIGETPAQEMIFIPGPAKDDGDAPSRIKAFSLPVELTAEWLAGGAGHVAAKQDPSTPIVVLNRLTRLNTAPADFHERWFDFFFNLILVYGVGIRLVILGVEWARMKRHESKLNRKSHEKAHEFYVKTNQRRSKGDVEEKETPLSAMDKRPASPPVAPAFLQAPPAQVPQPLGACVAGYKRDVNTASLPDEWRYPEPDVWPERIQDDAGRTAFTKHLSAYNYIRVCIAVNLAETLDAPLREFINLVAANRELLVLVA